MLTTKNHQSTNHKKKNVPQFGLELDLLADSIYNNSVCAIYRYTHVNQFWRKF